MVTRELNGVDVVNGLAVIIVEVYAECELSSGECCVCGFPVYMIYLSSLFRASDGRYIDNDNEDYRLYECVECDVVFGF